MLVGFPLSQIEPFHVVVSIKTVEEVPTGVEHVPVATETKFKICVVVAPFTVIVVLLPDKVIVELVPPFIL